ncbi:NAD(P)-dependent dehydrogenase (short-subunit alcohol dehydrogenase family) [Nakamurella sp. UYEF19]
MNTVAPGATLTPGNAESRAVLDQMTTTTPAGKVVRPYDIAAGVVYLVSDAAEMIRHHALHRRWYLVDTLG